MKDDLSDGMDPSVIYRPKNPVATFTDQFGEQQIVHAPKGRSLRKFKNADTPQQRMNRAAAILLGHRVYERRKALGLSQTQLSLRAGFVNVHPKQFINKIEKAVRREGVRLGSLYALASALECQPGDLLGSTAEIMEVAGVEKVEAWTTLQSGQPQRHDDRTSAHGNPIT